jgi:hypothetical protein
VKQNRFSIDTLIEAGILQEVNRVFFHPLGLALAVKYEEGKPPELSCVLETEDPEGWIFNDLDNAKVAAFNEWKKDRTPDRLTALGWEIQPIDR